MSDQLETLVRTLLWEGYALYPYTPGATKNATPTPFGIVYPPVYAAASPTTFDRIRVQAIAEGGDDATLAASVRFLEPSGERHVAVERRVELPATPLSALADEPVTAAFSFDAVEGRVRMAAQRFDGGLTRVTLCVHNSTPVADGLDRVGALRASLLSTHVVARVAGAGPAAGAGTSARAGGARFCSPVAPPEHAAGAVMTCTCVNTFPALASDADDVLLGAAIALPDHPRIAPESRGDLFDGTEIEEALLLHLHALSDGERAEIAEQDPAVREMLERAVRTTPADIVALHGRVTVRDPVAAAPAAPPAPPAPAGAQEVRGERQIVVDGVSYERGARVRLRPAEGRNAQDHLLRGRPATIERIYLDYEDRVHLCVTVDDDPGQELMRDIGRYLYFRPDEVELLRPAALSSIGRTRPEARSSGGEEGS
ncbi:hypothetical protein [Conexibacter woesei]|uniref:Uncharacterized protein n=1 Tax=Conexibacter woesei (strain DSM 14684 / CCUG 47730 / CIP 108061 / JCM 11494 / NBRC 100937 / ID131577) TaxID=469383 RepID=D3F8K3_CONWI|nr:hypothetical protein [Conexibacter woesei]ADB50967.1 conserved hypothetical protein [Conexibacter woesei DSM 14684]